MAQKTDEPKAIPDQAAHAAWEDRGDSMDVPFHLADGRTVTVNLGQQAAGDVWAAVNIWWDRHFDDD